MAGGGEPAHIQADLGEDHLRAAGPDPGDLIEALQRRDHGRVRGPVSADGPVLPSASTPRAAGIAPISFPMRSVSLAIWAFS